MAIGVVPKRQARVRQHDRELKELACIESLPERSAFCYGHRLLDDYEGKCRHLHGHNGRAVISLEAPELDAKGMLVDFSEIKRHVQRWIDDNLDHNLLLCRERPAPATS